jgi:hypothetical protein
MARKNKTAFRGGKKERRMRMDKALPMTLYTFVNLFREKPSLDAVTHH